MRLFLPFGSASSSFAGARIFTVPPAFSTAAIADFEARQTEKFNFALEFAFAEELHAAFLAPHQASLDHDRGIDRRLGIDQASVDRGLYFAEIDFVELDRK